MRGVNKLFSSALFCWFANQLDWESNKSILNSSNFLFVHTHTHTQAGTNKPNHSGGCHLEESNKYPAVLAMTTKKSEIHPQHEHSGAMGHIRYGEARDGGAEKHRIAKMRQQLKPAFSPNPCAK